MPNRATANLVAVVTFFAVLVVGAWVVGRDHGVEHPKTTTVVTKSAVAAGNTSQKSTQVVLDARGRTKTSTKTTTTTATPAGPASTETTSVDGGRSFIERVLGDNGVVFLQFGVVLLAAFIAGAAIQRVLVGQFGGFKVGMFEIAELAGSSAESVLKLEDALAKSQQESSMKLHEIQTELAKISKESSALDSKLSGDLALVASHLAGVEAKLTEHEND